MCKIMINCYVTVNITVAKIKSFEQKVLKDVFQPFVLCIVHILNVIYPICIIEFGLFRCTQKMLVCNWLRSMDLTVYKV